MLHSICLSCPREFEAVQPAPKYFLLPAPGGSSLQRLPSQWTGVDPSLVWEGFYLHSTPSP